MLLAVVIVWQVPHTIWLRYILLIGLGVAAWPIALRRLAKPGLPLERTARWPFIALAAFIVWGLVVALFVSPSVRTALNDLRAEWLAPTLILLIGYGLALRYPDDDVVVRILFLGCVLHAFMHLISAPYVIVRGEHLNISEFGGISNHRANVTYTTSIALGMLIADTAARARGAMGFLRINTRWAVLAFALLLASTILATTRNGLIVFALLCVAGFVLVMGEMRRRVTSRAGWMTLVVCALLTLAGAMLGLRAEPRWSNFFATAPVAWDTDNNRQWLRGEKVETGLPMTSANKPVEPSAYFRIAYLKEGLRLIEEHPWGTRVGRDAYRLAIIDKYGSGGMSHAHNGYLDLAVSVGIPGLLLWFTFVASFIVFAVRAPATGEELRLALVLVVAGFAARTFLDATVRDHIIQEFMIAFGALVGAIVVAGARQRA